MVTPFSVSRLTMSVWSPMRLVNWVPPAPALTRGTTVSFWPSTMISLTSLRLARSITSVIGTGSLAPKVGISV